jgi:carbon monoxide dehydrogenase subunit G
MASAARELLATPEAVWGFLAEPHHLGDWWPGVVAVEPDRRGFTTGARWRIVRRSRRGLLPLASGSWQGRARSETLVLGAVAPGRRVDFTLVGQRPRLGPATNVEVSVELEAVADGHARVTVEVRTRPFGGADTATARVAVARLYALVQTAATL